MNEIKKEVVNYIYSLDNQSFVNLYILAKTSLTKQAGNLINSNNKK